MGAESHLLLLRQPLLGPLLLRGGRPAFGLLLSILHQHGGGGQGHDWECWHSRAWGVQGPAGAVASEEVSDRQQWMGCCGTALWGAGAPVHGRRPNRCDTRELQT